MVKIVQVLNFFLPTHIAGTETYVNSLSNLLRERHYLPKIIIPNYKKNYSSEYKFDDLIVLQFAEPSIVDRKLIMGFRPPEGLDSFVNILESEKPDIVHFHEIAGSNGITLHHLEAAKSLGIKILFTFHLAGLSCMNGTLYLNGESLCDGKIELKKCTDCYLQSKGLRKSSIKLVSSISRFLYRLGLNPTKNPSSLSTALGTTHLVEKKQTDLLKLISLSDKVIALTEWYKEILILNGISEDKIIFIQQGLPIHKNSVDHIKKLSNKIKFLFIGRITHFKGVHLLIEAFLKLDQTKVELHIYGHSDGSEYDNNLKKQTQNISSIHWHGLLDNKKVVSTMSDFDALCLCSTITEMSPLVIQEAFAAGIPVIASNVYGNAEQIKHGVNGLLFNFNDPADLLKQLQRCIDEKELLSNLSRNILPPRSFEEVANNHIKLYNSLLS